MKIALDRKNHSFAISEQNNYTKEEFEKRDDSPQRKNLLRQGSFDMHGILRANDLPQQVDPLFIGQCFTHIVTSCNSCYEAKTGPLGELLFRQAKLSVLCICNTYTLI